MTDTSTEAVDRFTYSLHSLAQYEYLPEVDRDVYGEAINLIRALAAERDALRAKEEAAVAAAYEDAANEVGQHLSTPEDVVWADDAAERIRYRANTDALAARDARVGAEALREAANSIPLPENGNAGDPQDNIDRLIDEERRMIRRAILALIPADQEEYE